MKLNSTPKPIAKVPMRAGLRRCLRICPNAAFKFVARTKRRSGQSSTATPPAQISASAALNRKASRHPIQSAMIDLYAHGYDDSDIVAAVIATREQAQVDYILHTVDALFAIAPDVALQTVKWA